MLVYRLTVARWAGDLSGEGSRRFGGRWNERGTPALYTASSAALALLETLVHLGATADIPAAYTVTAITVEARIERGFDTVPPTREQAQSLGQVLLADSECMGFWVPSIVIPRERNLVLNPGSDQFTRCVRVQETYLLPVDERLGKRKIERG